MAQIKVMYLGNVYNATGKQMEYFELKDTMTVRRLLFALVEQYGNQFKEAVMNSSSTIENIWLRVMVGVNGRDINALKGLDTELKDGDSLIFMVPAEGGCQRG
ncbi:MAG TPA: MoaD family protein [Candidatus Bathyarchaeia archaeon]|nr:MoaD family protein [Candidatus Bathyarchaeia archaeon]